MNEWLDPDQHAERAHEHYEAGRWDDAEEELRQAIARHPWRADLHFNLALTQEAAGRFDDAVKSLKEVVALEPGDASALLALGVNCLRLGEMREAVAWLEKAQHADADHADSFVYRIEAYARLGEHDQAEHMFYRALQVEGDHAMAYANMGESLLTRELWTRAAACFEQAAKEDPNLPRVYARLALARAGEGKLEDARGLYLRELRSAPGDVPTLIDLGCLLLDLNRIAEAGEKFRRVLELDADHPEAHFHLGEIAQRQHRTREALASYRRVLQKDPAHADVRRRLARLLLDQGQLSEARRLLRQDLGRALATPAVFHNERLEELGQLLLDAKVYRGAARVFAILHQRTPGEAQPLHLLGVSLFEAGERRAAMDATRRALRLKPALVPALHNMALASIHERQWARAGSYIAQALRLAPDDHGLRRLRLLLRLHRVVQAVRGVFGAK